MTNQSNLPGEEHPEVERYVGMTEIAKMLGLTPQRTSALHREGQLPAPSVAIGPIYGWRREVIEAWAPTRNTRPGRKAKASGFDENDVSDQ